MKKLALLMTFGTSFLAAGGVYAAVPLTASQMDSVTAGVAPTPTGFVCPVIKTENVLNSPKGGALGDTGDYTIGGPMVAVPMHATNGDGTGIPAGPHSSPGDTDYSAIWYFQ